MSTYGGQGDYAELMELQIALQQKVEEISTAGVDYATAERNYRVALKTEILKLRAKGQPVTIVSDLARGDENVANLKLTRDATKSVYEATIEAVNVLKLRIRMVNEQINREWNGSSVY